MRRLLILTALMLLGTTPLGAQQRPDAGGWSALRISKWAALTATAATAVYGVTIIRDADASYEDLELACQADPVVCQVRRPNGSYADTELERQYQAVRRQDRRARNALLASQIGVAATVVLFIIDLRHARSPADIPYVPRGLEVGAHEGGVRVRLRVPVG